MAPRINYKKLINKKLSYSRDSARQRSLRRSRSFRVTFDINRKPVCDLTLYQWTILSYILSGTNYRLWRRDASSWCISSRL